MPLSKVTKYGDGTVPLEHRPGEAGRSFPSRNFADLIIRFDAARGEPVDRIVQKHAHYYKPLVQDASRRRAQLIEIYNEDTPLHHEMNSALRNDDYEAIQRFASFIWELREAFRAGGAKVGNTLGPFEGLVYRSIVLSDPAAAIDMYQRDTILTWPSFTSTTTDRSVTEGFGNVLFEIRCLKGVGASDEDGEFSPADIVRWSVFQDADEVLFPPNVKFRVVNIRYPTVVGETRPVVQCEVLWTDSVWALIANAQMAKVSEWCRFNRDRVRTEGSEYSLVHHAADVDLRRMQGLALGLPGQYLHEVLVDHGAHPMEECPHTNNTVMEKAAKLPGSRLGTGRLPQLTQLFVTIPEGAPSGSLLSIPVDGADGPVTATVPEGYPAGSLLVLTRRSGSDEWVEDVGEAADASATGFSEFDQEQESAALVPGMALPVESPPTVTVRLDTTVGIIDIVVRPDWAPHGAQRFLELAASGDLDDLAFYRAVKDCLAQFGLPAKRQWPPIPDDIRKDIPFLCGAVCFAAVGPNSRKSTLFICIGDMSTWFGKQPWETPIGAVAESSLSVLDAVETCYGDIMECGGTGPEVNRINMEKNGYLRESFPKLTYIRSARPVDWASPGHSWQALPSATAAVHQPLGANPAQPLLPMPLPMVQQQQQPSPQQSLPLNVAPPLPGQPPPNGAPMPPMPTGSPGAGEAFNAATIAMRAAHAAQVAQAADAAAKAAAAEAALLQQQAQQAAPAVPPLIRYPAYRESTPMASGLPPSLAPGMQQALGSPCCLPAAGTAVGTQPPGGSAGPHFATPGGHGNHPPLSHTGMAHQAAPMPALPPPTMSSSNTNGSSSNATGTQPQPYGQSQQPKPCDSNAQVRPMQPSPFSFSEASSEHQQQQQDKAQHQPQPQPAWRSDPQQQSPEGSQQQQPAPSPTGSYVPPPTGSCQVVQSLSYVPPVMEPRVQSLSYVPPIRGETTSFGLRPPAHARPQSAMMPSGPPGALLPHHGPPPSCMFPGSAPAPPLLPMPLPQVLGPPGPGPLMRPQLGPPVPPPPMPPGVTPMACPPFSVCPLVPAPGLCVPPISVQALAPCSSFASQQ